MEATVCRIQQKVRSNDYALVSPNDFQYSEIGIVDATVILNNPAISLYSVDPTQRKAIFVETDPEIDISLPPFYYQSQYCYARRLFLTSFETLYELADVAEKNIDQLVVIYSVGRCGSTWLSKIFAQASGASSLSEPDVFSQIVLLREPGGSNECELLKLLQSCLRLVCKPSPQKNVSTYVLKLRSFCIEVCDLINRAFPQTQNIFLYRDLEAVVNSSIQVFDFVKDLLPIIKTRIDTFSRMMPLLKHYGQEIDYADPYAIDLFIVAWLSVMYRYEQLRNDSIPFHTLRYEDLNISPQHHISDLFNHYGLVASELGANWEVLTQDAQAGTSLSRRKENPCVALPDPSVVRERMTYFLNRLLMDCRWYPSPVVPGVRQLAAPIPLG
ncbi:sulfotransferase domain-containing protein [Egbenema bharatensis]|uniref:sulfotransferase domain-containing protein n=1 Tax=Egbenema bharatensis TaxID=3463334 RepID=UPI003A870A0B